LQNVKQKNLIIEQMKNEINYMKDKIETFSKHTLSPSNNNLQIPDANRFHSPQQNTQGSSSNHLNASKSEKKGLMGYMKSMFKK
jgi:hypothetical protein